MKEKLKNFWKEHGESIKLGAKCLAAGFAIGFIKGALCVMEKDSQAFSDMSKKIPYEPDYCDVNAWVYDNPDLAADLFANRLSEEDINNIMDGTYIPEEVNK